jgi:7-cyano-7-deazaguanine synthase
MCSVFGVICLGRHDNLLHEMAVTQAAWNRSAERGSDSWGRIYFALDGEPTPVTKVVNGSNPSVQHLTGRTIEPTAQYLMLGQRRGEPTTEWVTQKTAADKGPFTSPSGRWIFTHNGTIANDHGIGEDANRPKDSWPTQIDSYAIGVALDTWGWNATVREVLNGSFALLAIDTESTDPFIYYATNYKPIFTRFFGSDGYALITSQRSYLADKIASGDRVEEIPPYTTGVIFPDCVVTNDTLYPVDTSSALSQVAVVCSGGLDSSVVAWRAHRRGNDVTLLHFRYGCKAEIPEQHAILKLARAINDDGGRCSVVNIPLDFFKMHAQSVLTDKTAEVNHDRGGVEGAELAHEWVPARNLIMMALAMGWCEANGVHRIALGTNLEEGGAYPDNEPEFLNKLRALTPYALRPYFKLTIETPVGNLMKHQIVRMGLDLGMPFQHTWSCYEGGPKHCGTCGPCSMRKTAFAMNGVGDPVFTGQIVEQRTFHPTGLSGQTVQVYDGNS